MRRLTISLVLDGVMLLSFAALMSWRLTGVPIHEWLAVALLLLLAVHLVIHGRWVETRAPRLLRRGSIRGRLTVLLNFGLFVAMGTALTSGFLISKVIMSRGLAPGAYLAWHSLHDTSSSLTLLILGLHLALNWDLITAGSRRAVRPNETAVPSGAVPPPVALGRVLQRLAWVTAAAALLAVFVWQVGALLPAPRTVTFVRPDGKIEQAEPPAELTRLQPGSTLPSPARGGARFIIRFGLLGAAALAGRKVFKLRLE